jgi:copper chaperone NosL
LQEAQLNDHRYKPDANDLVMQEQEKNMRITVSYNVFFLFVIFLFATLGQCLAEDVSCPHCGMFQTEATHSWVIIEYDDGSRSEVCSIYCAAIDLVINRDRLVTTISVADYHTGKQINAYKAYWVIGGDIPGVMTTNAKWAFAKEEDALEFIKGHGGRSAVFEEAIRAEFSDLYEDLTARKRKTMMQDLEKTGRKN